MELCILYTPVFNNGRLDSQNSTRPRGTGGKERIAVRLKIRHNMEMAHRLSQDTTKCKQIHGHGMQVELVFMDLLFGENGMAVSRFGQTLEFGSMKRAFRDHIDNTYDHHLVLNESDFWTKMLVSVAPEDMELEPTQLPGLTTVPGEPTVENLAKWIGEWAASHFGVDVICRIDETKTNGAEVHVVFTGTGTRVMQ